MRQVLSRSLITVAAASGVLAMSGGYAHADTGAQGATSNSPGVLSGDSVQVPAETPVNLCGNSVNVVALLNPAMGNGCGDEAAPAPEQHTGKPAHGSTRHGIRHEHVTPPVRHVTPPAHPAAARPVAPVRAQLARTGAGDLGTAGAVSAGLLLSGAMLYRRTRPAQVRSN